MLAPRDTFPDEVVAHLPMLLSFGIALVRDQERAEDLVQDTAVRALTHRDKFTPGSNLAAWLVTILRNTHYSQHRRRWREQEDPDEALAKTVPFDDSPLRKLEAREVLALAYQMPPALRDPLLLVADGASYEEVAAEIGEHVGTVKSRVSRARAMIVGA